MLILHDEDRSIRRDPTALPVSVEVSFDASTHWTEGSMLEDVSALGAALTLKRPIKRGRLLELTFEMPKAMRRFDFGKDVYTVWGVVQRCIKVERSAEDHYYAIGVAFIGKEPPDSYLSDPTRRYQLSDEAPANDGFWMVADADPVVEDESPAGMVDRETRLQIPEELLLELLDESGEVLASESTVTENVSRHGAAVFTQFDAVIGSFVRVTSERHNITLISIIHDQRLGPDGAMRLHLEFIDMLFPLDGLD